MKLIEYIYFYKYPPTPPVQQYGRIAFVSLYSTVNKRETFLPLLDLSGFDIATLSHQRWVSARYGVAIRTPIELQMQRLL